MNKYRLVISIDFGTARSGFAYALLPNGEPNVYVDWSSQPTTGYPKTLTELLFDPEGDLIAWGYDAPKELAQRHLDPNRSEYCLIRNFKMQLREGTPTPDGPVFELNNEEWNALDLIVAYLQEMKKIIDQVALSSVTAAVKATEILWCLTVPAIWTDSDKQLMRKAAIDAGLIGPGDQEANRLLLVLEPEAAAISCMKSDESFGGELRDGITFMIVDAGGGTVDLTSHRSIQGRLQEVATGSGGPFGSTYVDREFENHLIQLFGDSAYNRVREHEPIAYLELMYNWENIKCQFKGNESKPFHIRIPRKIEKILELNDYRPRFEALKHNGAIVDEFIELSPVMIGKIFQPILTGIVELTRKQLIIMGNSCDYIFLVGGFAQSILLQNRMISEFGKRVKKVVIPPNPGRAVVEGAVYYGIDQTTIISRRSRLTYGCGIRDNYVEGIDKESKKEWDQHTKTYKCIDRFSTFVKIGDSIRYDQPVTNIYYPIFPDQTQVKLRFFSTDQVTVRYIDEPNVYPIGELIVELSGSGLDREIEVSMFFGRTELSVEAIDKRSGKKVRTNLKFDQKQ